MANPCVFRLDKLCIKPGINGKHRIFEPFTDNMGIGDPLGTDVCFAVVQKDAVPLCIVTALPPDKRINPAALGAVKHDFFVHSSGGSWRRGFGLCSAALPGSFLS